MPATANVGVTTLFSPFDNVEAAYLDWLGQTKQRLDVCIYGWHLPKMTDCLLALKARGVIISMILDHTQAEGKAEASEVQRLVTGGIPFVIGTSPVHRQILHSKFTVRDGASVEFGSWNYSLSASAQSNTASFIDSADYARAFHQHHDRLLAFIALHEMAMQLRGEVTPTAALPDAVPAEPQAVAA